MAEVRLEDMADIGHPDVLFPLFLDLQTLGAFEPLSSDEIVQIARGVGTSSTVVLKSVTKPKSSAAYFRFLTHCLAWSRDDLACGILFLTSSRRSVSPAKNGSGRTLSAH
jgi:hypothetical protein